MAKEAYVSFEVAKLLKEKGFDSDIDTFYYTDISILKPTQQMAMRWLREEKGLVILIDYNRLLYNPVPYYFHVYTASGDNGGRERDLAPTDLYYDYKYKTYEEACEAAVRYCLENLAEKINTKTR